MTKLSFLAASFIFGIGSSAFAQDISGSTTIDVDPSSNTVTATCETDLNGEADDGYYAARVTCSVQDAAGSTLASGAYSDDGDYDGYAVVTLTFTGTPGTTYTAVGGHSAALTLPFDAPEEPTHGYQFDPFNFYSYVVAAEGGAPSYVLNGYDWWAYGPEQEVHMKSLFLGSTYAEDGLAPLVTVKFTGMKTSQDSLVFSAAAICTESLGPYTCNTQNPPHGWGWNFEVSATVQDDASKWTLKQQILSASYSGNTIDIYSNRTPFTVSIPTGDDSPKPNFRQQTSGTKNIFWIDGPGPGYYGPPNNNPVDSGVFLVNFSGTVCSTVVTSVCSNATNYYVKIVLTQGGALDTVNSSAALGTGH